MAQFISSAELVRMAAIKGAKALGLDQEIGSLEVGKQADIIAVDMPGPGYSETSNVETVIVYPGSGRAVYHVWVSGEQLVRDRDVQRQDHATIRPDYSKTYADFWARVEFARKVA